METLWEKECGRLAETLDAAGVAMRVDKESFHHAGIRLAAVAQENPDTIRRSVIFSAIDPGEVLSHLGVAMQDDTEERSRADEPLRGVSFYRKIIDDAALQHDLEGMLSVTAT